LKFDPKTDGNLHNIGKKRRKKSGERTEEITTKREGR